MLLLFLRLCAALLFTLLTTSACTSQPVSSANAPRIQASSPDSEVYGPPEPLPSITEPAKEPPKPTPEPSVTLVLGGVGVASFATIGILKRFQEEGIPINLIVTSGWPTLFTLCYGYLKSIHDVEWFALRLAGNTEKMLSSAERQLPAKDLGETLVPLVISIPTPDSVLSQTYERGNWKIPLSKAFELPKTTLRPLDVSEAVRRGAKKIIAISMYSDYLGSLKGGGKNLSKFQKEFRENLETESQLATLSGKIFLNTPPNNFGAKRAAMMAGYREATRLTKLLRKENP